LALHIIREISTDVIKRGTTRAIYAKQNDLNSRFLNVRIQADGKDLIIDPSYTVLLNVERSDKAENVFVGTVNDDGTVQVPLTPWMLELEGTLVCDISIVSGDPSEAKLTTMYFNIQVEESVVRDENIVIPEDRELVVELITRTVAVEKEEEEALALLNEMLSLGSNDYSVLLTDSNDIVAVMASNSYKQLVMRLSGYTNGELKGTTLILGKNVEYDTDSNFIAYFKKVYTFDESLTTSIKNSRGYGIYGEDIVVETINSFDYIGPLLKTVFSIIAKINYTDYSLVKEVKLSESRELIITYLDNSIDNLGIVSSNISEEEIATAIESYLVKNPIEADTTPSYVKSEAQRIADNILAVRNSNSFVFAGVSDIHTDGVANEDDYTFPAIRHIGKALSIINDWTQLDLVSIFGDTVGGYFTTEDDETTEKVNEDYRLAFKYVRECFSDIRKSAPVIQLQGNHDHLKTDTSEEGEQKYWSYIGANNIGVVTDYANKFRNYGYKDFDNYKIRVIYLNTADVSAEEITGDWYISREQMTWLINTALNLSSKEDESEWGVLVFSHHHITYNNDNLLSVINAFKGKESGSITHTNFDNTTTVINYDFGNATAEFISHFHGHLHNFRAETLGTNEVLTITIPNACYGRNNEYGTSTNYNDEVHKKCGDTDADGNQRRFLKTANSTTETAFNMISVDRKNKVIYCYNYGAGIDRIWNYEVGVELATFNISTALTNCTADENNATTIYGTDIISLSFTADTNAVLPTDISVVGATFEWDSTSGILTLSKPTRNVVITITAQENDTPDTPDTPDIPETEGYTDIINIADEDYFQGYRVSTSTGNITATTTDSNYVATKIIDFSTLEKPVIIRTGGIICNANLYSQLAYCVYDANGSRLYGGYLKDGATSSGGVSIAVDENNNATLTVTKGNPDDPNFNYLGEVQAIRLTGYGNGADWIVTINEEIT